MSVSRGSVQLPTGATNKTIKNEFGKRLFRFVGVDLKDRINRAGANQPRDERDKTDQPDPADAAGEEQNQAQQSDANDDANPAIHFSNILFHKNYPSFVFIVLCRELRSRVLSCEGNENVVPFHLDGV